MVKEKKVPWKLILIVAAILFIFSGGRHGSSGGGCTSSSTQQTSIIPTGVAVSSWIEEYTISRRNLGITDYYILPTSLEDYNSPVLQQQIQTIASNTMTAEQATQWVLDYVFENITYILPDSSDSYYDYYCTNAKASDIITLGEGVCPQQTRVSNALLKGLGIAVMSESGCAGVDLTPSCLSYMLSSRGTKYNAPHTPPFFNSSIFNNKHDHYIRNIIRARTGGLHIWSKVWLPTFGWSLFDSTNYALESTSPSNYDCLKYIYYRKPLNPYEECIIDPDESTPYINFMDECGQLVTQYNCVTDADCELKIKPGCVCETYYGVCNLSCVINT